MKTITELISESPIGTVFNTEDSLPEASALTNTMLGKTFRCVKSVQVIECEDGCTMTLTSYAPGFDPATLEEDKEDSEEDDDELQFGDIEYNDPY